MQSVSFRAGFYDYYKQISILNCIIKTIQSRIEAIRIKESSGIVIELEQKIEKPECGFLAYYE